MCVRRTFLVKFHRIRGPSTFPNMNLEDLSSKVSSLVDVSWMKFRISDRFIDFNGTFS